MASALRFGPLGPSAVHLCIDMQTLFAERTDWQVPWLERVSLSRQSDGFRAVSDHGS